MEELIDVNNLPVLKLLKIDENVIKSVRLLSVFGREGSSVIFATTEDVVYGCGDNLNGCLGLSTWTKNIERPKFNKTLSYQNVVDIAVGFQHFLALTAFGRVYAWGQNNYGEMGIQSRGNALPRLVYHLEDLQVVQICCGCGFSMALTSEGHLYNWGRNSFRQLGLSSPENACRPTRVAIEDKIVSISCGRIHSMALTDTGKLYVWGVLKFNQNVMTANPCWEPTKPPAPLESLNHTIVTKAVCGPNYSLILTTEGRIYAFGNNFGGQLGKGSFGDTSFPVRIPSNIKFKDIIASKADGLSIGVSEDNQYYVWGYVQSGRTFSPKLVADPFIRSVFDVFAKYGRSKVTFETISINKDMDLNRNPNLDTTRSQDINEWLKESINDLNQNNSQLNIVSPNDIIIEKNFETGGHRIVKSLPKDSPPKTVSDNCSVTSNNTTNYQSVITQTFESFSETVFQNFLMKSFNNQENSDLKLIFKDKYIYCHKNFLKFRNKQFWEKCKNQFKNGHKSQIRIKANNYNSFLAFLQHLYGLTPEVNEDNCSDLLKLAAIYEEEELKDLCQQFLNTRIGLSNVCSLYERALESKSTDLEKSCFEFVSKNQKQVMFSEAFLAMDTLPSLQLMHALSSS